MGVKLVPHAPQISTNWGRKAPDDVEKVYFLLFFPSLTHFN